MTSWDTRSREEQSLLNPGFCSMLLWHAAVGYKKEGDANLSLEESFLIVAIVLHKATRDLLPSTVRTSLTVWTQEHPLERGGIGTRAQRLAPYTRESLLFGGLHGLLSFSNGSVVANDRFSLPINTTLKTATDEVKDTAKKALFLGRWFALSGGPSTVLALVGVRP